MTNLQSLRTEVLVQLTKLEEQRAILTQYIESVHSILNHEFMAHRVAEINAIEERICNLEHVYENERCTSCLAECLADTEQYMHHGSCNSCFYGGDISEEYPELDDSFECSDCKKSFEFSPFASITEGACLCPKCYDNSRYEVRFCLSASYKVFGGYVENVAKFTDEDEAIAFIEKHGDECESISIVRYNCTCKFLHGTCIDMCQYHINDMENR